MFSFIARLLGLADRHQKSLEQDGFDEPPARQMESWYLRGFGDYKPRRTWVPGKTPPPDSHPRELMYNATDDVIFIGTKAYRPEQ